LTKNFHQKQSEKTIVNDMTKSIQCVSNHEPNCHLTDAVSINHTMTSAQQHNTTGIVEQISFDSIE
jgi:hypothetical protein